MQYFQKRSSCHCIIQMTLEEHCTTVCAMSPALSLAFNPTTNHCQIHLEFADELELVDAPGYNVWQKVGQDSTPLGCISVDVIPCLLENTVAKLNDSADFAAVGSYDMKCVEGYYLTEQEPSDGKWYTTYTPPTLDCKDDGTWGVEKGGKNFKCLPIPETFPVYQAYFGTGCACHLFSTEDKGRGIIFYAIRSTAYCPEKQKIFWMHGAYPGSQDFVYASDHGWIISQSLSNPYFTYRGAWDGAYIVTKEGQCGATGQAFRYYQPVGKDHYISMNGIGYPAPWYKEGPVWWAWRE